MQFKGYMETINELNFPSQNKKAVRPTDEAIKEWGKHVDKLWERFLQLQEEGHLPNITTKDIQDFNETL